MKVSPKGETKMGEHKEAERRVERFWHFFGWLFAIKALFTAFFSAVVGDWNEVLSASFMGMGFLVISHSLAQLMARALLQHAEEEQEKSPPTESAESDTELPTDEKTE